MAEKSSGIPEFHRGRFMAGLIVGGEAIPLSEAIRRLGVGAENRKDMIARAARRAGISQRQAKALFYGEMEDPRGSVLARIEDALSTLDKKAEGHAREHLAEVAEVEAHLFAALTSNPHLCRLVAAVLGRMALPAGPAHRALGEAEGAASGGDGARSHHFERA